MPQGTLRSRLREAWQGTGDTLPKARRHMLIPPRERGWPRSSHRTLVLWSGSRLVPISGPDALSSGLLGETGSVLGVWVDF